MVLCGIWCNRRTVVQVKCLRPTYLLEPTIARRGGFGGANAADRPARPMLVNGGSSNSVRGRAQCQRSEQPSSCSPRKASSARRPFQAHALTSTAGTFLLHCTEKDHRRHPSRSRSPTVLRPLDLAFAAFDPYGPYRLCEMENRPRRQGSSQLGGVLFGRPAVARPVLTLDRCCCCCTQCTGPVHPRIN